MKISQALLILILINVSTKLISAQEYQIQNPKILADFYDVFLLDKTYAWVVGNKGSILRSTDGGENWAPSFSDTSITFTKVIFADSLTGWAIGEKNNTKVMFFSSDGGKNWKELSFPLTSLRSMSLPTPELGYACGLDGIIKTTNGGTSWDFIYEGSLRCFDVDFVSPGTGYVSCDSSTVLKTIDGGNNWEELKVRSSVIGSLDGEVLKVQFINSDYGFAGGIYDNVNVDPIPRMFSTSNGGIEWNEIGTFLNSFFYDSLQGWVIENSNIYKILDGEPSEYFYNLPKSFQRLYSIKAIDSAFVILVGENGLILKSTNGGGKWNPKNSSTLVLLTGSHFIDPYKGWAVGDSIILNTTNGGQDWNVQLDTLKINFRDVHFITEQLGFVVGWNSGNYILTTTDGGINWNIKDTLASSPSQILFVSETVGFIRTNDLLRTIDGGESWHSIHSNPRDIYFLDTLKGWTASGSYTVDGGDTWLSGAFSPSSQDVRNTVFFLNDTTGWIGGYKHIYKTTNGGVNWIEQFNHPINNNHIRDIFFYDENNGICIGGDGIILKTFNGGENWVWGDFSTNINYTNISNYGNTIWIFGNNGIIISNDSFIPVELVNFNATLLNNIVRLKWNTASETNNKGFEILRKMYQGEWETIAFISGNGTTTEKSFYSFADDQLAPSKYYYKLKQIDFDGSYEFSQEIEVEISYGYNFSLEQNFPNPFNPKTRISFSLAEKSHTILKIYDVLGNEVAVLLNEIKEPGNYKLEFDGENIASGIYYYALNAGSFNTVKKMILLK